MSPYLEPLHKVLVLTPDSVASTYCQRVITYYLNHHNYTTVNWHDLINHFSENYTSLVNSLCSSQQSIVARLSQYRTHEVNEPHKSFLKSCDIYFKKKIVPRRCSFETALSRSMKEYFNHPLNVYSKSNFKQIFYSTNPADIPLHIFDKQLKHIEDHYIWVESNFTYLTYVPHEDLIYDTDNTLTSIFGYTSDELNLTDLNKNIFLQYRDKAKKSKEFEQYETYCNSIRNQFPNFPCTLSAKKFTLSEKLTKVKNFDELYEFYSSKTSNHLETVSKSELSNRSTKEDKFFGLS